MSRYSLFTSRSFDEKNNKIDYYRGQDLKKQAKSIVDYEEKEMIELTEEEKYKHHISKRRFVCNGKFNENNDDDDDDDGDDDDDKKSNYIKVRDYCHYTGKHRGAIHKICNLRYNASNEIPVVFHNGSCYDYHFIIKGLAKEFKGDFQCLGEN